METNLRPIQLNELNIVRLIVEAYSEYNLNESIDTGHGNNKNKFLELVSAVLVSRGKSKCKKY